MAKLNVLSNLFDKVLDGMIAKENVEGKIKLALPKLFQSKPKSLGEGLSRIKEKFGVISQNKSPFPGERWYNADDGSGVIISSGKSLSVSKHIIPTTIGNYNSIFPGKLAEAKKSYLNINVGDKIAIDRSINTRTFKPVDANTIDTPLVSYDDLGRTGVKDLLCQATTHKHFHNSRWIKSDSPLASYLKI